MFYAQEESPDSAGQDVLSKGRILASRGARKESGTETIPPAKAGKGETVR